MVVESLLPSRTPSQQPSLVPLTLRSPCSNRRLKSSNHCTYWTLDSCVGRFVPVSEVGVPLLYKLNTVHKLPNVYEFTYLYEYKERGQRCMPVAGQVATLASAVSLATVRQCGQLLCISPAAMLTLQSTCDCMATCTSLGPVLSATSHSK